MKLDDRGRARLVDAAARERGAPSDATARDATAAEEACLVDALADRWGSADGGTRVWFEVDRPSRGEAA